MSPGGLKAHRKDTVNPHLRAARILQLQNAFTSAASCRWSQFDKRGYDTTVRLVADSLEVLLERVVVEAKRLRRRVGLSPYLPAAFTAAVHSVSGIRDQPLRVRRQSSKRRRSPSNRAGTSRSRRLLIGGPPCVFALTADDTKRLTPIHAGSPEGQSAAADRTPPASGHCQPAPAPKPAMPRSIRHHVPPARVIADRRSRRQDVLHRKDTLVVNSFIPQLQIYRGLCAPCSSQGIVPADVATAQTWPAPCIASRALAIAMGCPSSNGKIINRQASFSIDATSSLRDSISRVPESHSLRLVSILVKACRRSSEGIESCADVSSGTMTYLSSWISTR